MPATLTRASHRTPARIRTAFTKAAVAELSPAQIGRLTGEELIHVVLAVRIPFLQDDVSDHLRYLDRPALERLAYLARRTCRNQGY